MSLNLNGHNIQEDCRFQTSSWALSKKLSNLLETTFDPATEECAAASIELSRHSDSFTEFQVLSLQMSSLRQHNVAYVLVAEFDIDKGATVAQQYPHKTGTDEQ